MGKQRLVIGLTGGIGSGKSTVAEGFGTLGVPLIDADRLAHELVEPGQPALTAIVSTFGSECLTPEGRLDRAWMRRTIFADATRKRQLEDLLHPRIRQRIKTLLLETPPPYSILVIPLLLETQQTDLVDRILVVDAPEKEQRARVAARDGLSDNAIQAIMDTQADRKTRLAAADDILVNDGDLESLNGRIQALHRTYLELAHGIKSR